MKKPSVSIASIKFSSGQTINLNPTDKVLLVGPNNSGKSMTLREIIRSIGQEQINNSNNIVISDISIKKDGTYDELEKFMRENSSVIGDDYVYKDWRVGKNQLRDWEYTNLLFGLSKGFIKNITAENRLAITNVQSSVSPEAQKTVPQHVLYDDETLMKRISDLFRKTFDMDLFFNFRGGHSLPVHVGEKPIVESIEKDRISDSYVAKVRANPLLHKQGDGMRSYAGLLFEAVATERDITLIDEPEAFLHPPQMRKLGETLAKEVKGQLLVATHSSDIMRGFLTGTSGNIRILRIQRDGNVNYISEAKTESITQLWEQPVLRYSNALEGIFHEQTIICEDDSDCRLFNAVADAISEKSGKAWKDTAYVPAGGKQGIPRIAEVLYGIDVPTIAVFDFDFLSKKVDVKKAVESLGGDWAKFEPLWSRIDDIVKNQSSETTWKALKKGGVNNLPSGPARLYFDELDKALKVLGIFVVPVGEIEKMCPKIDGHGSRFVNKVLQRYDLSNEPELQGLREFVEAIHHWRK